MKNPTFKKLFLTLLLASIPIASTSCSNIKTAQNNQTSIDHIIPIIEPQDGIIKGAAAANGKYNIPNSPYYKYIDFYHSSPSPTLIKLDKFKTYQQTSDYTCGPACALMVLEHFGIKNISEATLAKEMNSTSLDNRNTDGSAGTSTDQMVNAFKSRGFNVTSSFDTQDKEGLSFQSSLDFANYIKEQLNANNPIIVENVEFGGHWTVIIGYDDMGTLDATNNHVIVMADPYDTDSHHQDGYVIRSMERFFPTWFDKLYFPKNQKVQQYLTVSLPTDKSPLPQQ